MNFEDELQHNWDHFVRYSRALAGSRDRGDDLLQESLVRAWRGFGKLDNPEAFKPWVLRIISNTHKSQIRLGWIKRLVGIESLENEPAPEELPFEEKELVRIALRKLPPKQREALILFEVLSMSVMEVAEIQNITLSATKSRLARGREKLQKRYHELNDERNVKLILPNNRAMEFSVVTAIDHSIDDTNNTRSPQ